MAKVAIVMGSTSDWPTMKLSAEMLQHLGVEYHAQVVSAHRTPDLLTSFAQTAHTEGYSVIIAGAGGAAHLPGMIAAHTHIPVLGCPVRSSQLNGIDSLLSIVQRLVRPVQLMRVCSLRKSLACKSPLLLKLLLIFVKNKPTLC